MPKNRNNHQDKIIPGTSVNVRNDDVNYALRKLKKILEREDRQKDLAKHEYFEKPSIKKKRNRDLAKRRHQNSQTDFHSVYRAAHPSGTKWMKSKRKRRRVLDAKARYAQMSRRG